MVLTLTDFIFSGDLIIQQGDDGDYFYVIGSGDYDIYINTDSGNEKKVNSFNGEGSFGELALMYSQPRTATVKGKIRNSQKIYFYFVPVFAVNLGIDYYRSLF